MNKEDLQALRNAYAIAVEDNRILKDRLEKIKEKCKEAIRFCDDCHYVDSNYICIDCTEGGRADLAKEIMEVLKDE